MFKRFIFLFPLIAILGIQIELAAYPLVYLSEESTWHEEGDDPTVTVVLSEASYLDVIVPFVIDESSTASIKLESDDEENDYYILESDDEDLGYIFDPESASGYLIFSPGQTEKSLDITVDNDLDIEENETIVFTILPDEVTVARPVAPLQQTMHILDNDAEDTETSGDKRVDLTLEEQEVEEGRSLLISIAIDSDVEEEVDIYYRVEFETADAQDIDFELTEAIDEESLTGSITHEGGGGRESVYLYTSKDQDVEAEEEVLYFILTSVIGVSGTEYPIGTERSTITIADNDPTTVSWDLIDDEDNFLTLKEGVSGEFYYQFSFTLSGPIYDEIEVPINIGGSATQGEEDEDVPYESDYYISQELPVTLEEGETSGSITIVTYNDDIVEDIEDIVLSLGIPTIEGVPSSITIDGPQQFLIDIEDNDPVSLDFARENPAYDADDEDSEEPYYIPGGEKVVPERNGSLSIPIYLSSAVPGDLTFDVTLDTSGSTATAYDPDLDEDEQDWDYQLSYGTTIWTVEEPTQELTLSQGQSILFLTLYLNDDEETEFSLGDAVPEDVEGDETVRISISNLQSEEKNGVALVNSVSLGSSNSFEVTIKELPDIEVTSLFSELGFNQSNWIDGQPNLNQTTGLFELKMDAVPPASLDADLTGYQSYKVVFNQNKYDINDPDNPENDSLKTNPSAPEEDEAFEYYVGNPYVLRYPSGTKRIVLKEGVEVTNTNKFLEENADTVEYANYLLRPLAFPSLEPQYDEEIDQRIYGAEEAFSWTLGFKSRGIATIPTERLFSEDAIRVYLTAEPTTIEPYSGLTGLPIIALDELEDGSIRLEVDTSLSSSIQIQYIGEDGIWRIAHPAIITTSSNRLFWIDRGPPATIEHPKDVDFRIYRVMTYQ